MADLPKFDIEATRQRLAAARAEAVQLARFMAETPDDRLYIALQNVFGMHSEGFLLFAMQAQHDGAPPQMIAEAAGSVLAQLVVNIMENQPGEARTAGLRRFTNIFEHCLNGVPSEGVLYGGKTVVSTI